MYADRVRMLRAGPSEQLLLLWELVKIPPPLPSFGFPLAVCLPHAFPMAVYPALL